MTLVSPQAMKRLRPIAMAGAPGSVAPMTSKSPAERCARYQSEGIWAPRCGSLASSGLPEAVIVPSTTQLFDPSAPPRPGSRADAKASDHDAAVDPGGPARAAVTPACLEPIHGMSAALRMFNPCAG